MCIIVYKPEGIEMPKKPTLNTCMSNNPHGAGLMYRDENNKVVIRKGFEKIDQLMAEINRIDRVYGGRNIDMAIHFRFATHGLIAGSHCHPFPITSNVNLLKRTRVVVDKALMHNGIIARYSTKRMADLSDTMAFVKKLHDEPIKRAIQPGDGKFCIMDDVRTVLLGKFIADDGVYYSNDGYKFIYVYKTSKKHDLLDLSDDELFDATTDNKKRQQLLDQYIQDEINMDYIEQQEEKEKNRALARDTKSQDYFW